MTKATHIASGVSLLLCAVEVLETRVWCPQQTAAQTPDHRKESRPSQEGTVGVSKRTNSSSFLPIWAPSLHPSSLSVLTRTHIVCGNTLADSQTCTLPMLWASLRPTSLTPKTSYHSNRGPRNTHVKVLIWTSVFMNCVYCEGVQKIEQTRYTLTGASQGPAGRPVRPDR